ncbi:MAG: endo alpha-1,4 polygalactosaminidase [Armatimonadetes bacterium]|nr:endo alpha-1,4 polygalactosaminidase [Armatimonadota bacterium]
MRTLRFATVLLLCWVFAIGCSGGAGSTNEGQGNVDYREAMRAFVQRIGAFARTSQPGFLLVPQNGHTLLTTNGAASGPLSASYVAAIDGVGREDLYYGAQQDNVPSPADFTSGILPFMDRVRGQGKAVLVADYCSDPTYVDDSLARSDQHGFVSFPADHRDLDDIPPYPAAPRLENTRDITRLTDASNLLYLLQPGAYASRQAYLNALRGTNYDILLIDAYDADGVALTASDVTSLKAKANGHGRLVLAYMSIGEAENYRAYWQAGWTRNPPPWLAGENPDWPGNFKVRYWMPDWQAVIFGGEGSYTQRLLDAGFDGAYLDIIDAYEFFEGDG